jgi:hypothetical protein
MQIISIIALVISTAFSWGVPANPQIKAYEQVYEINGVIQYDSQGKPIFFRPDDLEQSPPPGIVALTTDASFISLNKYILCLAIYVLFTS